MPMDENKVISVVSIGRSGAGKSSIGNVFLGCKNHWDGPFKTGATPYSCTKVSSSQSNAGKTRVYTDLPGIPDTDPKMTPAFYNICVQELKKPHTAVLFVFEYKRIDVEDFKFAELLFREINKVECEKILVINNRTVSYGDRPTTEDYQVLVEQILLHTKIIISRVVIIEDVSQMAIQLDSLAMSLEDEEATPSPDLKSFVELGTWIETLKEKEDFHREALNYLKIAQRRRTIVKVAKAVNTTIAVGAIFSVIMVTGGTAALVIPLVLVAAGSAAHSANDSMEEYEQKIQDRENMEINQEALAKVASELEDAKKHYMELRDKLAEGDDVSQPGQDESSSNGDRRNKLQFWKYKPPSKKLDLV